MEPRVYAAIDLKSFYASVECVERGLDPLTTNLVVADESRTEKTICLAVSPSLKKYGISGRARLFEVIRTCNEVKIRTGEEISYIVAPPRMQLYIDYSSRIYEIYLKYISAEDIHVYSIDEVFMDLTGYLSLYKGEDGHAITGEELVVRMIKDVYHHTGITATAGIGTNLYLAKIAMDLVAKHVEAGADGVRIATLDEKGYRRQLWNHQPLTDFWRIGRGIRKKLEQYGVYTMGDLARMSVNPFGYGTGEEFLFRLFGVDAELLIDHAWGIEPCTMADIKNYKSTTRSVSSGQVLSCGYSYEKGRMIVREMVELQVLELVSKGLVTNGVTLDVGYDREEASKEYTGPMAVDFYGRRVPKPAHGSCKLQSHTSSTRKILDATLEIYHRIVNPHLQIRRINISFGNILEEQEDGREAYVQMNLFTDYEKLEQEKQLEKRERKLQEAMIEIQQKYGKNAVLKGTNLQEGATTIERNQQIGGHRA